MFFLLLLVSTLALVSGHECVHHKLSFPLPGRVEQEYEEELTGSARMGRTAEARGMRIAVYFDTNSTCGAGRCHCGFEGQRVVSEGGEAAVCRKIDVLTPATRSRMEDILASAVDWIERALDVRKKPTNLRISTDKCGHVVVPSCIRKNGLGPVDFAVFVSVLPMSDSHSDTIAWAVPCQEDSLGRPIAGHINIVPGGISHPTNFEAEDARSRHNLVMVAVHELFHALGFSDNYWADPNNYGNPRPGWFEAFRGSVRQVHDNALYISTPRVVEEVAKHFSGINSPGEQCRASGMAIEQNGGIGSRGSHWEKRLMGNEAMTASVTDDSVLTMSRITLAYFEDSGHYIPNYDVLDTPPTFSWGKGKCIDDLLACNSPNFCSDREKASRVRSCTPDHTGFSTCSFDSYSQCTVWSVRGYCTTFDFESQVDCPRFQYDECPRGDCYADHRTQTCQWLSGERSDTNSKCFQSTVIHNSHVIRGNDRQVRCYSVENCRKDTYTVVIGYAGMEQRVTCESNKKIVVGGESNNHWSGTLECPPAATVCDPKVWTGVEKQLKSPEGGFGSVEMSPESADSSCYVPDRETVNGCKCQATWEVKDKPSQRCTNYCCSFGSEAPWCFVANPSCEGSASGICARGNLWDVWYRGTNRFLFIGLVVLGVCLGYYAHGEYKRRRWLQRTSPTARPSVSYPGYVGHAGPPVGAPEAAGRPVPVPPPAVSAAITATPQDPPILGREYSTAVTEATTSETAHLSAPQPLVDPAYSTVNIYSVSPGDVSLADAAEEPEAV